MSARDAILELAARHGLSLEHPAAARAEAAAVAAAPGIDDPSLEDLTGHPFVTIDEAHSRDLDQAIFVAAAGDGQDAGYRLLYAIADAAHAVPPAGALFAEALERGASYYLPGLTVPMLPRTLSEGVVSLNPGVDRRALVFDIRLDAAGEVQELRIRRARMRSRLKTTYDLVQAFFDGAPLPGGSPEIEASLEQMRRLGARRLALARARGVVEVRRVEVVVALSSGEKARFVASADPRNDVERWNEQISVLCNVVGARRLREGDRPDDAVHPIYRTHEAPTAADLEELAERIDALARIHDLDGRWRWRPGGDESLADFLARLPRRGAEGRVARAIQRQAMLAAGRSGFAPAPAAHYGVGAEVYGRFTAPMREVVGIYLHQEMWERLDGASGPVPPARLAAAEALRARVVEAAGRARALQRTLDREANRLVLDQLFARDLRRPEDRRPVRRGTVMGIGYGKIHVQLDSPPIDVKVYLRHLREIRSERLRQGRDGIAVRDASGHPLWAAGGAVGVRVRGRDEDRDRWVLELVDLD